MQEGPYSTVPLSALALLFFFNYLFLERGREGERGGEKHQCVVASGASPTVELAGNPGMCFDLESNGDPLVYRWHSIH